MEMKQCAKCLRVLPMDSGHFNRYLRSKDGFYYRCKECSGRKFTKPKPKAREGYKICSKCGRELKLDKYHFFIANDRKSGFVSRCKEREGTRFTEPIIKDGYKVCARCGKTLKATKEFFQTRNRNKNQSGLSGWCKKCYNEWHRSYYKLERVKLKSLIYKHIRYAREKRLISTFTESDWEECLKFFDYKDAYTGLPMEIISEEHIIPVTKGGNYVRQNIIPCEVSINSSKFNFDMEEWYKTQPFYDEQRLNKIHEWMGVKNNIQQLSFI